MARRQSLQGGARTLAIGAVAAALSVWVLYIAAVSPTMRLALTAMAGLLPAAAVVSAGLPAGFLCYGSGALLAFILLPAKDGALLYALFFGIYPVIKYLAERVRRRPVEWLIKLAFFNAVLSICLFGFSALFFVAAPVAALPPWAVYLGGNLVFLIYDIGLSKLITFYARRIDRILRKRQPG